ncbi:hypothetical protein Ancab_019685 [Ancistrocladus abbreviatus]
MTEIQRASLPHSLCGRDILGASKTGSGKTLAFVIPVLEKLNRLRWGPEDGVGSIIISPTRELAIQLFNVLNSVGRYHGFSAGLLIGGHKDVDTEKECVNELNILVCTPGQLLQHTDETLNFECLQLQVLVLDEADQILKRRDLARLSLKDPEYLSVHEESLTATPNLLHQSAIIVPLEQKLDVLWSFIKAHLNSRILVFLTTRKQVNFVFEAFKKLRPGIPLKCLHGKMNQEKRLGTYSQFCGTHAVLFSTNVSARGLDFEKAVDWVVQVDCPSDVASYIHRIGRTARYNTRGRSLLFLGPSEEKMLDKLRDAKVPLKLDKVKNLSETIIALYFGIGRESIAAEGWGRVVGHLSPITTEFVNCGIDNWQWIWSGSHFPARGFMCTRHIHNQVQAKRMQPVSALLAALLVKFPDLQHLARRAFITYIRAVHKEKDKEVFDVTRLPIDEFSALLGLPMTPHIRFLKRKNEVKNVSKVAIRLELDNSVIPSLPKIPTQADDEMKEVESPEDLQTKDSSLDRKQGMTTIEALTYCDFPLENFGRQNCNWPATRILKKKKLKINVHRPVGARVVFDEEGNALPPLATLADTRSDIGSSRIDVEKVHGWYDKVKEKLKEEDEVDKVHARQLRKEKRMKEKMKWKRGRSEEDEEEPSESDGEAADMGGSKKKSKTYFDTDSDGKEQVKRSKVDINTDAISLEEQEALALKLLDSMHR